MKYCVVPFGCQMNLSDTERIRTVLERLGFQAAETEAEADVLGLVACSVRQKAIDKVYARVHRWNQWKRERPIVTFASGCVLPADREKLVDRFDLLFTINELPDLPEMLATHGLVTPGSLAATAARSIDQSPGGGEHWTIAPTYTSRFEAFVPIQNGCNKFCTFCAVPYTRGREVSRPSTDILEEVRTLARRGFRSITLLGQNVNSYGRDGDISFAELLEEIGHIDESASEEPPFWLYFTSPHPRDMTPEVIDTIARHPVLAKQFHLPLQSGDDAVLKRMNRGYRLDRYRQVVRQIRATLPEATLFTDIIVGFSGETGEQFERTREAMREFAFNMAYVAMYSPRPGAKSARWEDDVPLVEKRRRLHALSEELQSCSLAYNRELVGQTVRVLVEGLDRKPGFLTSKTEGRLIVRFRGEPSLIGRFAQVHISTAAPLSLEGQLVDAASLV